MKEVINIKYEPKKNPYQWVILFNPDSEDKETIAEFDCFYEATRFMNDEGYSIVYLDDDRENKGQLWGVRKWT